MIVIQDPNLTIKLEIPSLVILTSTDLIDKSTKITIATVFDNVIGVVFVLIYTDPPTASYLEILQGRI